MVVLARTTKPVSPSPERPPPTPRHPALDDIDDGPDPVAPRLSLALGDMFDDDEDEDDLHVAPPRRSLLPELPDDGDTMHSVEFGRRALSEDPRMIFGLRTSDRFGDLNELGIDAGPELEIDGAFITRRPLLDHDQLLRDDNDVDDTTAELRALADRADGRPSDFNIGAFGNDDEFDEPTFRFTIPQRGQPTLQVETGATEDDEDEGAGHDAEAQILPADDTITGLEIGGYISDEHVAADPDLQAYREEVSAVDRSLQTQSPGRSTLSKGVRKQRKVLNISKYGHEYPSLPALTVKKLAMGFARSQGSNSKLSKDAMASIMQATEWFFEQVSDDLCSYAQHAGRKMIDETDAVTLMKRYVTKYMYKCVQQVSSTDTDRDYQTTPDNG